MDISPAEASEILRQIRQIKWKWVGVKRFTPEAYATAEQRYSALEQHHSAETTRMIEVIEALCRTVVETARQS